MTLEEAKEIIAKEKGYKSWSNLECMEWGSSRTNHHLHESAELYARSKWDESQELLLSQIEKIFRDNSLYGIADTFAKLKRNEFIP